MHAVDIEALNQQIYHDSAFVEILNAENPQGHRWADEHD